MKNILVTGGAGFIGSHTVVELVAAGYNPIIVDNFSNSEKFVPGRLKQITGKDIALFEGDYQDAAILQKIFGEQKIDGVIHFAAFKAVGESVERPLEYYDNNVVGFIAFLKFLTEQKFIPPVVFSSSCTVYGEPDELPVSEEALVKPATSPYGSTKQMCETILHDTIFAQDNFQGLALRYFNPIGAHHTALIGELPNTPTNLVPILTQAVAGLRKELTVYGDDYPTTDGTCIRDYIHVVDLAKAHIAALEYLHKKKDSFYDVCNVGTGKGHSVLEVIETFQKVTHQKVPYVIGARRSGDVISTYAAVDKARKVLGWRAQKTLSESLMDAWRWQQTLG
jgi:UDP-glucose 4-epimerase